MEQFHTTVRDWFLESFEAPTEPQLDAWNALRKGNHVLVGAPTGSGKTLAAFLTAIDGLVEQAVQGTLQQQVSVIYVSPLKALSNDIHRNLEVPLIAIQDKLLDMPNYQLAGMPRIESAVRTGDTTQWERTKMIKTPPHILVTTPESLYILLTSASGRNLLTTAKTLIVDEIHAMVASKRGAHLALSIERLQNLCGHKLTRIGLSATQEPIETVKSFLVGANPDRPCEVINSGHHRKRDLEICLPKSPLEAVMAGEVWSEIYEDLEQLILSHKTTLIFVNTRRLAERLAKALGERLGEEAVTSHHGSLAREHRFSAEQRLKKGQLRALVATASLELGIDIGDIDLVCQIGSPRAVSVFLQRVGRSGHSLGEVPKGRLFPLSRDELVECVALLGAVQKGVLDQLSIYPAPLDVLAQQVIAEVAAGEVKTDDLYTLVVSASPYSELTRQQFDEVVKMVAEGFNTQRGRRSAYLYHDQINGYLRPRKSARLTAITNGGTIPDQFDYDVVLQPEGLKIGTLNEDFAFESLPGDIFQLGNTSYQILKVETGKVFVRDARGQPPNIPFWFGEAPGRTDAMSDAVSELRSETEYALNKSPANARQVIAEKYGISATATTQLVNYLGAAYAALGALPTNQTIIFERFFDEAGDQHFVIHSAFGSRMNRAWGLALRKRFCRKFNFELQAAALEDTIILSLGATHSFPLEEPATYLKSKTVKDVLIQALLDAPMFPTHWRWNATLSLAVKRFSGGKKSPPQFQRSNAEDLIALIFPDQIACAENLAGYREIPDHPLVAQTLYDCLYDLMDVKKLEEVLTDLDSGNIKLVCCDLTAPSPLSEEVLTAKPYAFLDDAPAEERRTSLVRTRQFLHPEDAAALGHLDQQVVNDVRMEAWPKAEDVDECHDALMILGGVSMIEAEYHGWAGFLDLLQLDGRAQVIQLDTKQFWLATEKFCLWQQAYPQLSDSAKVDNNFKQDSDQMRIALTELVRMRLQGVGPITELALAEYFGISTERIHTSLLLLEQEGFAMRGVFEPEAQDITEHGGDSDILQWCERGLLARIHRRTMKNLRKQIQPASINGFMRYLFSWQGLDGENDSEDDDPEKLASVLEQLEGVEIAAAAWEESVLPARLNHFKPYWLDILCSSGRITWKRAFKPNGNLKTGTAINNQSPIALIPRMHLVFWGWQRLDMECESTLSHRGKKIQSMLVENGPMFFDDFLAGDTLVTDVELGLAELAGLGMVTSDNYAGLRALVGASSKSGRRSASRGGDAKSSMMNAGRWTLSTITSTSSDSTKEVRNSFESDWETVEHVASVLLKRYGIVFRKLLENESGLPPWRDLHYVFRRMEARGEVRGGRFVNGFAGEQFGLPSAVGLLRKQERETGQSLVSISAADPLNLTGSILPQDRVAGIRKNRLIFRDGQLIATLIAGEVNWLVELNQGDQWQVQQKLTITPGRLRSRYRHQQFSRFH